MRLNLLSLITFFTILKNASTYKEANQNLHQMINTAPIESFVLHSPLYRKEKYGIVLLVVSAQYEKAERAEIRKGWAAKGESFWHRIYHSMVIFLVGRSSELDEEAATYGDLLQVDIDETYRNLVYKIEVGFRWIYKTVQSEFVAKIDSDTVVHIDRLYDFLNDRREHEGHNDLLVCSTIHGSEPVRYRYSPWYVSHADFPDSEYPSYCAGPGYVMKRVLFNNIVERMGRHAVIEVEDAFFTGIVRQGLDSHMHGFTDIGMTASPYTEYSECNEGRPILSILNTHFQFGSSKSRKDLTAAWKRLKKPTCYNSWSRMFRL